METISQMIQYLCEQVSPYVMAFVGAMFVFALIGIYRLSAPMSHRKIVYRDDIKRCNNYWIFDYILFNNGTFSLTLVPLCIREISKDD